MKHENFTNFFQSLTSAKKKELARYCGVSVGHLRNISYGLRRGSTGLALSIESWSNGEINGRSLGVRNWQRYWPELESEGV